MELQLYLISLQSQPRRNSQIHQINILNYLLKIIEPLYLNCFDDVHSYCMSENTPLLLETIINAYLHLCQSFKPKWHMYLKSFLMEDNLSYIPWMLMTWRCREPGHQRPWYLSGVCRIFWALHCMSYAKPWTPCKNLRSELRVILLTWRYISRTAYQLIAA